MEPRNIGVVLWADGNITSRFVGESDSPDSHARLPQRLGIPDRQVYQKWVEYWRQQIEQPALTARCGWRTVKRSAPEFLDALTTKSDFSFMLVPGGTLRTEVSAFSRSFSRGRLCRGMSLMVFIFQRYPDVMSGCAFQPTPPIIATHCREKCRDSHS